MKTNLSDVEALLICPVCSQTIIRTKGHFFCKKCNHHYPTVQSIPILISSKDRHKTREAAYHSSISDIYRRLHHMAAYRNYHFHKLSLKPILKLKKRSIILELGCGIGYDAITLLKKGHLVVETDISPGQVQEARKQIGKKGLGRQALFYIADAENIPFANESFNASFIVASLHHLENPLRAIQEMKRCTKYGGSIIIAMEPNRYEWILVFGFVFSFIKQIIMHTPGKRFFQKVIERADRYREPTIERTFSKGEILLLAKQAGLSAVEIKGIWFFCGFIHWFLTMLNKLSTKNWTIRTDIEALFVHLDDVLARFPILNNFACHWTIQCTNTQCKKEIG